MVGIQCLIRDRVVSQWLQELLTPSSGLDHADAELPITDVLDICRGLVHEAAPRANVDPVILVQKLRSHDEVLLEELLKVRMSPEPKCFQHQDWAEGFELLMRVLTDTTPADYGPVSLRSAASGNLCCQMKSTAPSLHPLPAPTYILASLAG